MDAREIARRRQEIVAQHGAWTAHNIHLGEGEYTFERDHPKFQAQLAGHGIHLRRILQIASDIADRPLDRLRVLDLACLEGLYGIEFARHGSQVVGVEGREANIEKARFAGKVLALENLSFVLDDVRNLSAEKYGTFDVVLGLGILYHLDAPDVFAFIEKVSEVCRRVAIIDTHVAVAAAATRTHRGHDYRGRLFTEHSPKASAEKRRKSAWASLDNERSFWLTRPSLFNALSRAGFTTVSACQVPAVPGQWLDRDTLVAVKGARRDLLSIPPGSFAEEPWPEESRIGFHPGQTGDRHGSPGFLKSARALARRVFRR
jgi:2-polyprenyl-3-methyl-5-hydroxy-6-metoxy-1,4-benzoquinol methylase